MIKYKKNGFTLIELLITVSLLAIVTLGYVGYLAQTKKFQQKLNDRSEVTAVYQLIHQVFSNKSFCDGAFLYHGSPAVYDPVRKDFTMNEIRFNNTTVVRTGDLLPGTSNIKVSNIRATALSTAGVVLAYPNDNISTTYISRIVLSLGSTRLNTPNTIPDTSYLVGIVVNNSTNLVSSCYLSHSKLEKANATRFAFSFDGTLAQVGCSVTNWNDAFHKSRYMQNNCIADPVTKLCPPHATLGTRADIAHRDFACSTNPGAPSLDWNTNVGKKKNTAAGVPINGFLPNEPKYALNSSIPYPYNMAKARRLRWKWYFPIAQEGTNIPVYYPMSQEEDDSYARAGGESVQIVTPQLIDNVNHCSISAINVPHIAGQTESQDQNSVFLVPPSTSTFKNYLALGCRSENGWFITGCTRANDGGGATSAEIIYDPVSKNQFCVTQDFRFPHADERTFSNLATFMSVLCARTVK
jgi:prepilin-type N-terminal cleavage/methylation domain-containing protein